MASPPYHSPATSPPYPPHAALPNPRKRPSLNITSHQPAKRRKPSNISVASSAHPLRQTSFPPEESAITSGGLESPSVESDGSPVTGDGRSVATADTRKGKWIGKGRGEQIGNGSVKSRGRKTADERSGMEPVGDDAADEDEDDDGDGIDGLVQQNGTADTAAETENLAVLMEAFDPEQYDRFTVFKRETLKKQTVRRIVNQTLSQSVPPSVITTINGFTKVFVGNLIERARRVQQESAQAVATLPSPPPSFTSEATAQTNSKGKDLGPLLPDHLREALRRYKRDGDGGGAGLAGHSVGLGVPGARSAKLGGRRLFR